MACHSAMLAPLVGLSSSCSPSLSAVGMPSIDLAAEPTFIDLTGQPNAPEIFKMLVPCRVGALGLRPWGDSLRFPLSQWCRHASSEYPFNHSVLAAGADGVSPSGFSNRMERGASGTLQAAGIESDASHTQSMARFVKFSDGVIADVIAIGCGYGLATNGPHRELLPFKITDGQAVRVTRREAVDAMLQVKGHPDPVGDWQRLKPKEVTGFDDYNFVLLKVVPRNGRRPVELCFRRYCGTLDGHRLELYVPDPNDRRACRAFGRYTDMQTVETVVKEILAGLKSYPTTLLEMIGRVMLVPAALPKFFGFAGTLKLNFPAKHRIGTYVPPIHDQIADELAHQLFCYSDGPFVARLIMAFRKILGGDGSRHLLRDEMKIIFSSALRRFPRAAPGINDLILDVAGSPDWAGPKRITGEIKFATISFEEGRKRSVMDWLTDCVRQEEGGDNPEAIAKRADEIIRGFAAKLNGRHKIILYRHLIAERKSEWMSARGIGRELHINFSRVNQIKHIILRRLRRHVRKLYGIEA